MIEDCIRSVFTQTYQDIEHIIIDSGSTDGTSEVIKKYEDKIARSIRESESSIYSAMNKGIKFATGDIVGILNSDDIYANEFVIEKVVKADEVHIEKLLKYFRGKGQAIT